METFLFHLSRKLLFLSTSLSGIYNNGSTYKMQTKKDDKHIMEMTQIREVITKMRWQVLANTGLGLQLLTQILGTVRHCLWLLLCQMLLRSGICVSWG